MRRKFGILGILAILLSLVPSCHGNARIDPSQNNQYNPRNPDFYDNMRPFEPDNNNNRFLQSNQFQFNQGPPLINYDYDNDYDRENYVQRINYVQRPALNMKILIGDPRDSLIWVDADHSNLNRIRNLVFGGHDSTGTPTFICRDVINNIPGWVSQLSSNNFHKCFFNQILS